jgi:hypothetical protein
MKPSYVQQGSEESLPSYLKQEGLEAEGAYQSLNKIHLDQLSSSTGECTLRCKGLTKTVADKVKRIVGYEENKVIARLRRNGINPFSQGFSSVTNDIDVKPEKVKVGGRALALFREFVDNRKK